VRRHHCWLQQVASARDHDDGRFHNGHDAATQAGDDHDPSTTAADHPAAGGEL
jgi:hypothetical protein